LGTQQLSSLGLIKSLPHAPLAKAPAGIAPGSPQSASAVLSLPTAVSAALPVTVTTTATPSASVLVSPTPITWAPTPCCAGG